MLIWLLFACALADDILIDGSFEESGWDIVPSWTLCNTHSACSVPVVLGAGARTGSHFIMVYPGRRLTIGQKFEESGYSECRLGFYAKTTSEIDTFMTVYWGTDIYELSSYQSNSVFAEWNYYNVLLDGSPASLEIEIVSNNIAYIVADDFSLICSQYNWSWSWSAGMITLAVVIGCVALIGYKVIQQRNLVGVVVEKYNLHWPEWLKFKRAPPQEIPMDEVNKAFMEDSE